MADIFPTGYFAAQRFLKGLNDRDRKEYTAVCVGCGPVGICAMTCALTMVDTVYAIDSIPERLEEAKKIGAIPINLNDDPVQKIKDATGGRGADVVMELVGHADAFQLCFDMIRPWGQISSIGVQYVSSSLTPPFAPTHLHPHLHIHHTSVLLLLSSVHLLTSLLAPNNSP